MRTLFFLSEKLLMKFYYIYIYLNIYIIDPKNPEMGVHFFTVIIVIIVIGCWKQGVSDCEHPWRETEHDGYIHVTEEDNELQ